MRDAWLWLAFLGSAAATLAAHATDPRVVAGPPFLASVPDLDGWEVRTTPGGLVRATPSGVVLQTAACAVTCRAAIVLHTMLPDGPFRATVEVHRDGELDRARLFAVDRRPDRSVAWYTGRNLAEGEGTASVDLPASLSGRPIEIGVVAVGNRGTIDVGHLDVVPTRTSPGWIARAALAGAGWAALGAVAVGRMARRVPGRVRWFLVALAACVVVGVLLPRPDPTVPQLVQKLLGHAGAFALLAAIARSTGAAPIALLVRLGAFAVATELVQLFRTDRSASIADVALDLLGACIGLLAVRLFRDARRAPPVSAASPP